MSYIGVKCRDANTCSCSCRGAKSDIIEGVIYNCVQGDHCGKHGHDCHVYCSRG
jgi:hypothetical protein